MPEADFGQSSRWLTCLTIDPEKFGADRENRFESPSPRTILKLARFGSRCICSLVFKDCQVIGGAIAEDLFQQGLCLPSGSNLTNEGRDRVIKQIKSCFSPTIRAA